MKFKEAYTIARVMVDSKMPKINKKGVFGNLVSGALGVIALIIAVVVGISILATMATVSTISANGNATGAINDGITGLRIFTSFSSIVVIAIVGAVVLGLVMLYQYKQNAE